MRFSHALVRDAVYGELSALRLATLHARVGEALEQRAVPGTRLAELAEHFFQAAPILGPERGWSTALAAAEAAQSALAYERAEDDLRRALGLVELLPAGAGRIEREPLRLGEDVARAGGAEQADRAHEPDPRLRGAGGRGGLRPRPGALRADRRAGRPVEGADQPRGLPSRPQRLRPRRRVRRPARDDRQPALEPDLARVRALDRRGRPAARRAAAAWRASTSRRRASLAASSSSPRQVADSGFGPHPLPLSFVYDSRAAWIAGDGIARRTRSPTKACGWQRPSGIRTRWPSRRTSRSSLQILEGDAPRVLESSGRAIAYCDEHGLTNFRCWFRLFRGWAVCEQGRPQEGADEMAAAFADNQATGARINSSPFRGLLAAGELRRGDHERALAILDEALERQGEDRLFESDLHRRRGEVLAAMGPDRRGDAVEALRTAVALAEARGALAFKACAEAALRPHRHGRPRRGAGDEPQPP